MRQGGLRKIILIEPAAPEKHAQMLLPLPRLGLPIIGAILKRMGHEVRIYCEPISLVDWEDVLSADLVGISTTTCTAPRAYAFAQKVREKGIPVVLGGSHTTFMPEEALQFCNYVVRGEGEKSFPQLLKCLEEGSEPEEVPGVSWVDKTGQVRHNSLPTFVEDLDSLPFPEMGLIVGWGEPLRRGPAWLKFAWKRLPSPLVASRGCPWNCKFCTVTKFFGRTYRFRSPRSVVEEIKARNLRKVFFYDDNLVAKRDWAAELAEGILKKGMKVNFSAQMRADVALKNPELLSLLRRAGLYLVYVGLEAVDPETLHEYRKGYKIEEVEESLRTFHEMGIRVHGMFVFGADFDTTKTPLRIAEFALKNGVQTIQISLLTPLPGSDYYEELDGEERIFTKNWALYDGFHAVFIPKNMTPFELQVKALEGYKRFYSLKEVAKSALKFHLLAASFREIGRKVTIGLERANSEFIKCLKVASDAAGRGIEGIKETWRRVAREARLGESELWAT